MNQDKPKKVAILYAGDVAARRNATPENGRFLKVFQALSELGMQAEPAVYHDDFRDEVRRQLLQADGVLVWVNPIEDGHDRVLLDALLREVATKGVYVSTHPDIILKLGTRRFYTALAESAGDATRMFTGIQRRYNARFRHALRQAKRAYSNNSGGRVATVCGKSRWRAPINRPCRRKHGGCASGTPSVAALKKPSRCANLLCGVSPILQVAAG